MGSDLENLLPGIKYSAQVYTNISVAYGNFYLSKLAAVSCSPNTSFHAENLAGEICVFTVFSGRFLSSHMNVTFQEVSPLLLQIYCLT